MTQPLELPLTTFDIVALAWFTLLVAGYKIVGMIPGLERRNIITAVQRQRVKWMQTMVRRDNRVVDTFVVGNLGQGNAFFASTSAIAIGGLTTVLGKGDAAREVMQALPYAAPLPPLLWEIKVIFMAGIFVYAFFKFAWAFRMSHYTGIMIGATPLLTPASIRQADEHAHRCAIISGLAAEHSSSGLRAFYYSIAALAWFFHPLMFMLATTWVLLILTRRDYFSLSRAVIAEEDDLSGVQFPGMSAQTAAKPSAPGQAGL
jgi:uncharacterized membrane protein